MPVRINTELRRISQDEFASITYSVIRQAFAVHNEMGRFFDESIYRNALAARIGSEALTEVRVDVTFDDFAHEYFLDLLVCQGALFELKCVSKLTAKHRAQLLNYLLLTELFHGKLINMRPINVEHEFVNTGLSRLTRQTFQVITRDWLEPGHLASWFTAFLSDLGTGLEVRLYEKAVTHFFGGDVIVLQSIPIGKFGRQRVRLASPEWAIKVTVLPSDHLTLFEQHAQRWLAQTNLHGIHWINVAKDVVMFRSIRR